jgi:Fur family ferric uptake transcriptional regulator
MQELTVFENYLKYVGLRMTRQRESILKEFLKIESHISAEEFYSLLKNKNSAIGQATVFRTLKLLVEAGIAASVEFSNKTLRYEHRYNHIHHDHLICIKCGKITEAVDPEIEKLQEKLAQRHDLKPVSHVLQIFGICGNCAVNDNQFIKKEEICNDPEL